MEKTIGVRRDFLAALVIAFAAMLMFPQADIFAQTRTDKTDGALNRNINDVEIKGPGALFIAPLKDGVGFWLLTGTGDRRVVRPVQYVRDRGGYNKDYRIMLSSGITAVFFADDLDLSRLSFTGKPEIADCPVCTVAMPLELRTAVSDRDDKFYEQFSSFESQLVTKAAKYEKLGAQMQILLDGKRIQRPR